MILYHGSNVVIDEIDLLQCKPYKDFGKGFYLTDIKSLGFFLGSFPWKIWLKN